MATKENNLTTYKQHLSKRYGIKGSEKRTEFEIKAKAFLIGELIKEERKNAKMTQEQLADKIGAKKSFIFSYLHYIDYLNLDWVKLLRCQLINS